LINKLELKALSFDFNIYMYAKYLLYFVLKDFPKIQRYFFLKQTSPICTTTFNKMTLNNSLSVITVSSKKHLKYFGACIKILHFHFFCLPDPWEHLQMSPTLPEPNPVHFISNFHFPTCQLIKILPLIKMPHFNNHLPFNQQHFSVLITLLLVK